jgi:hypothetical protein
MPAANPQELAEFEQQAVHETDELVSLDRELELDNQRPEFTLQEALDNEMERWGIDYNNNDVDLYE